MPAWQKYSFYKIGSHVVPSWDICLGPNYGHQLRKKCSWRDLRSSIKRKLSWIYRSIGDPEVVPNRSCGSRDFVPEIRRKFRWTAAPSRRCGSRRSPRPAWWPPSGCSSSPQPGVAASRPRRSSRAGSSRSPRSAGGEPGRNFLLKRTMTSVRLVDKNRATQFCLFL